jgi:hypothetical protein
VEVTVVIPVPLKTELEPLVDESSPTPVPPAPTVTEYVLSVDKVIVLSK